MYKTGGLESTNERPKIIKIDNSSYALSDKFKTMIRDSFIDWGTFIEIYNENLDDNNMFEQVVKMFNVKGSDKLKDIILPLVKTIYHLPMESHMMSMIKQFMINEPLSIAIHSLFTTIKRHYEEIVEKLIIERNTLINANNLKSETNNIEFLLEYWRDVNIQSNLDSSSLILTFINPPEFINSKLILEIVPEDKIDEKLRNQFSNLITEISNFHYMGFCPREPQKRLSALLDFPINSFIKTILLLDEKVVFPDYANIEKEIGKLLKKIPTRPKILETYKREDSPTNLFGNELIKWYVDEILNLRKTLVKHGRDFEQYYIDQAYVIVEINDYLKTTLNYFK